MSAPGTHLVEQLEQARERLRGSARASMGVTGDDESPPLKQAIAASGVGWYPALALSLLIVVDQFQGVAFTVLGPEISRALGISRGGLAGIAALKLLAVTLASMPMAALVQKRPRRALVAIVTGFAWSVLTLLTGFVTNAWSMIAVLLADGASTGSVGAVHPPLLMDSYPPEARVRVLSLYRGFDRAGDVLAPLMVAVLTAWMGFTWRGVFLVMGITSVAAAFFSIRLRDPGFGRWDSARVRNLVRQEVAPELVTDSDEVDVPLGFYEIVRRLVMIPTLRRLYATFAAVGMLVIPLGTYVTFFLDERWGLGPGGRGIFFGAMPLFSIAALVLFGKRGESLYRDDPARLVRAAAGLFAASLVCLVLSILSPVFVLMVVLYGMSTALTVVVAPAMNITVLSIIPPRMRPHSAALTGISISVGGLGGLLLLGGIDRRFGLGGAIVSIAGPGLIAAAILRSAAKTVNADLDRMLDDMVEEEEVRGIVCRGGRLPMLACRRIDFAYGRLQVLFGVDFSVEEGEMVALLGTNGAGKSTLLRVISGLGLPSGGSVRLEGRDITFVDPERRVGMGIIQVPGGRSVFGPLTVADNLRLFATAHGRNKRAAEAGIEASFGVFPRLAERRDQLASTLSGGEQQMLGLSQALILRPRLLLIDELSLGLAPKVVGELLDMVRAINAAGTAVVLVEQSVNIALSVVNHAYFMEKGEIRFDGASSDLLARPDLLRSVFLAGAARDPSR